MKRRNVLKGIAAGSAMSMGVAGATSSRNVRLGDLDQYDRLLVKDGDRVVRTVESPTWDAVRTVEADLNDDQRLVTPDEDCVAFCEANCPCKPCAVGCFDCCNVQESICDCCSEVSDPNEVECCEGC